MAHWTQEDIAFLNENIGKKLSVEAIAQHLNRTEMSVRLFCTRHRINTRETVKRPIMVSILQIKFGAPEYFQPTKAFYERVGINQKRFSLLRCGYAQPTEAEIKSVCRELNMNHEEYARLLDARQLNMFEDQYYESNSR